MDQLDERARLNVEVVFSLKLAGFTLSKDHAIETKSRERTKMICQNLTVTL